MPGSVGKWVVVLLVLKLCFGGMAMPHHSPDAHHGPAQSAADSHCAGHMDAAAGELHTAGDCCKGSCKCPCLNVPALATTLVSLAQSQIHPPAASPPIQAVCQRITPLFRPPARSLG